jgi:K+-sensing histidine kinase KdpD
MEEERRNDILMQLLIDKVDNLTNKLDAHMIKEEKDKEAQAKDINEIKETFKTAKTAVLVVKWGAAIIAALAASWLFLKENFIIGVK